MFLTQPHPSAVISGDGDRTRKIGSKDAVRYNIDLSQEIENVLEDYPEYPYQVAFSIDELRQQLVAHVLRHIPFCYSVFGEARQQVTTDVRFPYRSKEERLRLDALIRGSILHLLRENADWVSHQIHQLDNSR